MVLGPLQNISTETKGVDTLFVLTFTFMCVCVLIRAVYLVCCFSGFDTPINELETILEFDVKCFFRHRQFFIIIIAQLTSLKLVVGPEQACYRLLKRPDLFFLSISQPRLLCLLSATPHRSLPKRFPIDQQQSVGIGARKMI